MPFFAALMPRVEAYMELRRRHLSQPMSPELGYELIRLAYNDEKAAMQAKMKLMLNSMPEPKEDVRKYIK